jgi:hypothetical protein
VRLVPPGGWGVFPYFFSVFKLGQLFPQWGVVVWVCILSSGSREELFAHQLSYFGVVFLLCWFIWGLFLCLVPFLGGKVRDLSAGSLLSACYDGLLIVFQFCNIVWLWILLSGSGNELCGPLSALFQAVAYHLPTVSPSAFPAFVYWKFQWRSASCSFPLLQCAYKTLPPLLHVPFQFIVYYSVLFFQGGGSICPGGYADLFQGWLWEYCVILVAHLLVCQLSSKQVWS